MRQDRKNSHIGTGETCTELRIKKREYLPQFKRKDSGNHIAESENG